MRNYNASRVEQSITIKSVCMWLDHIDLLHKESLIHTESKQHRHRQTKALGQIIASKHPHNRCHGNVVDLQCTKGQSDQSQGLWCQCADIQGYKEVYHHMHMGGYGQEAQAKGVIYKEHPGATCHVRWKQLLTKLMLESKLIWMYFQSNSIPRAPTHNGIHLLGKIYDKKTHVRHHYIITYSQHCN